MHVRTAVLALAAAAVAACEPNGAVTGPRVGAALQSRQVAALSASAGATPGAVYTLTNQVSGNAVAVFARGADGGLTAAGTVATGGTGTGASLGSQGAVALSGDGRWLFAVNAGSNDVSVFNVSPRGLTLAGRTASGGTLPISLTVHGGVLYVLNAGGTGNISGFAVGTDGALTPIAGATLALSGPAVGPAEVQFSPDGGRLVVTEKNTNLLDVYTVDANGVAAGPATVASAGGTPFGFAFGLRDELFVSEAAGSASSYVLGSGSTLALESGAVSTHQGAPCWAVVTGDGRFGYTGNGAGSVSAFGIAPDGEISLVDANGGTALIGAGINDIALSHNSRYLYVLQTAGAQGIHAFRVEADGHLTALGTVAGLPGGTRGLAAY
jgi:6-phosphogluconolactonase